MPNDKPAQSDEELLAILSDPKFQQRFWQKVEKTDKCWVWTSAISAGYGHIYINGKSRLAHRISYTMTKGLIAPKMVCDHLCRNRACVNPSHIEIVTNKENILRGEGLPAKWNRRDECENGHPYSGDNLYLYKGSVRQCRQCRRDQKQARRIAHLKKELEALNGKPEIR